MRRLLLLLAVPALLGAAQPGRPVEPVDYAMAPVIGADGLEAVEVTIRFRGDADGATDIGLPDRWAGSERLHERVQGLALDGGTIAATGNPAVWSARHPPGAPLVLRYRLGPLSAADPGFGYEKARPALRPGWFYIHGEGAIAAPIGRNAAPARFRWAGVPAGWAVASNLDVYPEGRLTVNDVGGSLFAGGTDLRVTDRIVGGRPLRVAMRGDWAFDDEAFADALARVIGAGNDYLAAEAIPFFVSLAPLTGGETGLMSTGGSGRPGGFALASTANRDLDYFIRLLGHEYGHRWFGGSFGPVADPDGLEYWFTEGIDDFMTAQALVRGGVWSEADYAAELNDVLLRYGISPARTRANAELASAFWQDRHAQQMLYDRGHLFALALDAGRPVGPALVRMAREADSFPAGETQGERFARAAGLDRDRLAAMLGGGPVVLDAALLAPCGTIGWVEQPAFASGFTVRERDGVAYFDTVDENGPAWAAGLRPGMRYVRRESVRPGDSTVPIVLRVADEAGERVLSWLPRGREAVRFQRLELGALADEAERAACRARLGGRRAP